MILKGDCIKVMKAIKPNSVDAIVCDPPYGLEFMGKEWDKLWKHGDSPAQKVSWGGYFKRKTPRFDTQISRGLQMQLCHTQWLTEAYRILRPGGSMLVMGGTRTSHRLACAVEDSGFIIKDTLMWLYGSGFPKAQDLGKMIDKKAGRERKVIGIQYYADGKSRPNIQTTEGCHEGWKRPSHEENYSKENRNITAPSTDLAKHWDGFKVGGIKPAYEPIIWAVKPPEGSYVDNVLKWGVGAVNVDECRVEANPEIDDMHRKVKRQKRVSETWEKGSGFKNEANELTGVPNKGRFPANIILSHHPECVQVGVKRVKGGIAIQKNSSGNQFGISAIGGSIKKKVGSRPNHGYINPNGLETVEAWDCHPDCAVRLLDEQSGDRKSGGIGLTTAKSQFQRGEIISGNFHNDNGGASRFFYCAKASRGERNAGLEGIEEKPIALNTGNAHNVATLGRETKYGNNHPTVKPMKLFEWLIKLVTREGQIVLDPFIGSGTTAIAAHNAGRKCIGIEKESEYLEIAKRRIAHWKSQPQQLALGE